MIDELKLKKVKNRAEHRTKQRVINNEIRLEIHVRNKIFKKKHKKAILILDAVIILTILMNLGALAITNALVMKVEPGQPKPQLQEANPIVAKTSGYELHPNYIPILTNLFRTALAWSLMVFFYIYRRNKVYELPHLNALILYVVIISMILGIDFIRDLGFLIGKIIF